MMYRVILSTGTTYQHIKSFGKWGNDNQFMKFVFTDNKIVIVKTDLVQVIIQA